MGINRLWRSRDGIYLDTNAWSILSKGQVPIAPLIDWAKQNGCFFWLTRMQVAELSANREVIVGLAGLLGRLGVFLIDRGQNEFSGEPWHRVRIELQQYLLLNTDELRQAFVAEFSNLHNVRRQLAHDAQAFGIWISQGQTTFSADEPRNWSTFPQRLETWIRQLCERNGHAINEAGIRDSNCYVGLRLSYAVLFSRYFVYGKQWEASDYLDYLHAADMAYAKLVVTERNLAEMLRQGLRRREVVGPDIVVDTSWLRNPFVE